MLAVVANGLIKRFESTCVIDGVSLTLCEGEVRGLLGPNGAGKTTLLRMLFGLVRADEGAIELFGRQLDANDMLALDGVSGFVEEPSFYPYLSGRANLEILSELDESGAYRRIDAVLEQVQLATCAGSRVSGYSSGMRQRLGIAAALMRSPRLLLLDEPTSALDPAGARLVVEMLQALSERGVAMLVSSHKVEEVEGLCDSFAVLSQGRIVWEGTSAQMLAQAPPSAHLMVTSDNSRALQLAHAQPGIRGEPSPNGALIIEADDAVLDEFVLALGRANVAVRGLKLLMSPLQSMYSTLTGQTREGGLLATGLTDELDQRL